MASADLARQQRCVERIRARWPAFLQARQAHLRSHSVGQAPTEKVAENILCDLFTQVLDWTTEQARLQENLIDLTLTRLGVKYLIIEAKRPGSLDGPGSIARAVRQARGYAEQHKVDKIAVSDGCVLEAYDLTGPALAPRLRTHLSRTDPPEGLWWLSTRGIYRVPDFTEAVPPSLTDDDSLLHPKYQLPAGCFAYVGDPRRTSTWKLPFLEADGTVDSKRLPKAIQSVLRDYRGEQVRLPEEAVPEVLARLADAAARQGRMPEQDPTPAPIYLALSDSLRQFTRT
ncbi:MAG TPA: hypothetical protein VMG38_03560 [Trebonia sp.]|nr:hypothetical protein [Trebonia sp.]